MKHILSLSVVVTFGVYYRGLKGELGSLDSYIYIYRKHEVGPPNDSVQSVFITPISLWFMVRKKLYYLLVQKPTNITGGVPHCKYVDWKYYRPISFHLYADLGIRKACAWDTERHTGWRYINRFMCSHIYIYIYTYIMIRYNHVDMMKR